MPATRCQLTVTRRVALVALAIMSIGGCVPSNSSVGGSPGNTLPAADKVGDGEIRTATAALSKRWPALGTDADIASAH